MSVWWIDLLAKPAYGEHWAQQVARPGPLRRLRRVRRRPAPDDLGVSRLDVIRAFNENMPFDQFTIEQLAGDLLPYPTEDQLIATAFHRNTLTNNEGGTNDEEFRNVAVVDRVNTTMAVWMGTTMALRPVPHPQVRPDHAGGVLPVLRHSEQHTGHGSTDGRACSGGIHGGTAAAA